MKILYIGVSCASELPPKKFAFSTDIEEIIQNASKPAVELCAERELDSYSRFTRGSVSEFMTMFSKTVAERTRPEQRQDVEERGAYREDEVNA